jgi:hypothetical protein
VLSRAFSATCRLPSSCLLSIAVLSGYYYSRNKGDVEGIIMQTRFQLTPIHKCTSQVHNKDSYKVKTPKGKGMLWCLPCSRKGLASSLLHDCGHPSGSCLSSSSSKVMPCPKWSAMQELIKVQQTQAKVVTQRGSRVLKVIRKLIPFV